MVLSKDPTSTKNISRILDIFNTQIQDTDSSVYLVAVEGLTALGDLYTERVLPVILQNFTNSSLLELTRLKLGETIVKIIKRIGEAIVKYGNFCC